MINKYFYIINIKKNNIKSNLYNKKNKKYINNNTKK